MICLHAIKCNFTFFVLLRDIMIFSSHQFLLQELMSIVWEYFGVLASKKKVDLKRLNSLIEPLCDIARDVPLHAGLIAKNELKGMQTDLLEDLQVGEVAQSVIMIYPPDA